MGTIYKLIIEDDEGKTTVYPLSQGEISIGRKEGNTIRLMERNVSRRHARLLRNNGSVFIEDLDSYNGIRINGERINGRYEVKEGDLVEIGDYHLALQAAEIEDDAHDRHGAPTIEERKDKDEWPLAGTVPDFRLPEEILAGVRGQLPPAKPTVTSTRDTIPDTPVQQPAPTPSVLAPGSRPGQPAMQARDPLIGPPPRDAGEGPRSLPPFPLPGGLPPSSVPFLPARNVPAAETELRKPGMPPALKRDSEQLPTVPMSVGPQRVATVPRLVCVSTTYAGREFALTRPELIIGRVEDNDIVIEHRSVSRNHAKIVFDGRVHKIIDLQSANGILVNGEEYAMTDLRKNDLIELGHVRFRFVPAGEAFAATDEELREMREAGVNSPAPESAAPSGPMQPSRSQELRASEVAHSKEHVPVPPSVRPPAMAAQSKGHDSASDVTPGFDPSTAATVTDTPLSALTVGLLTPEVLAPPAPSTLPPNEPTGPRRIIEEKRRSEPPHKDTAPPSRGAQAHDQRPTEINIAARTNGTHGGAAGEPFDVPLESKKAKSASRAPTEPMTRPPMVEVEGRLEPPKMTTKVGVLLALAFGSLAAVALLIFFFSGRESPYLKTINTLMGKNDWAGAVNYCAEHREDLRDDAAALERCFAAQQNLVKQQQIDESKKSRVDPSGTNEAAAEEETAEAQTEKPVNNTGSEEERKAATKKATTPVAAREKAKPQPAQNRARARELANSARKALMSGDLTTAEEGFKECLRLAELPECYRNLGVLYAQQKDTDKSIKFYRKYLEISPNAQDADYIRGMIEGSSN